MSRQERETTEGVNPVSGTPETPVRTGTISEVREREIYRNPVTWEEMRTMMRESPERVPVRTWRPVIGGVLAMIAGIWNIIVGIGIVIGALILDIVSPSFLWGFGDFALTGFAAGITLIILGLISTIGGYLAVNRRSWGFSLFGSIAALVPSPVILPFIFGVFSTMFVGLGRREFKDRQDNREVK